ncbi:MAG: ML domain-containing protein [Sporichthyaceae bacterium]
MYARSGSVALVTAAMVVAGPVGAATAASLPFTRCGTDASATVTRVDVSPHPLQPGRDVAVTVRGKPSERVTAGSYDLTVFYLGSALLQRSGKLGDVAKLPLSAGEFRVYKRVPVPQQAPSGEYRLRLRATDQDDGQLLCISVPFEVN